MKMLSIMVLMMFPVILMVTVWEVKDKLCLSPMVALWGPRPSGTPNDEYDDDDDGNVFLLLAIRAAGYRAPRVRFARARKDVRNGHNSSPKMPKWHNSGSRSQKEWGRYGSVNGSVKSA